MGVRERLRDWAERTRSERDARGEDVFADLRDTPEQDLPELTAAYAEYGHVDTRWRDATKYIDLSTSVLELEALTRAARIDDGTDDGIDHGVG